MLNCFSIHVRNRRIAVILAMLALVMSVPAGMAQDIKGLPEIPLRGLPENPLKGRLHYAESQYRIMIGDVLSMSVYNQPDLSDERVLVRSDGNASFRGIGEVLVAGQTLGEVRRQVELMLGTLVIDPIITMNVVDAQPVSVYLAGAVMRPGLFQPGGSSSGEGDTGVRRNVQPSADRMASRLTQVLAESGGVRLNADLSKVAISRDGAPYRTVNLWRVLKHGSSKEDIVLQAGDTVYVPALPEMALSDEQYSLLLTSAIGPKTFPVRVIGEVEKPGVYELNGQSPLLNSAIAKSGGFKEGANRKVLALRRFSGPDKFSTLFIDPAAHDFMLRPNDVIYVSELGIYKTGRFAETVSQVLSPFTNVATSFFGLSVLSGGF